mgnify:CR=1 FL=1
MVLANEVHDVTHRGPRRKYSLDSERSQARTIHIRDDPTKHDQHIVEPLIVQELHHARADVIMRTRKN